eukprot:8444140-Pyramimonas_sp.AAC.1
MKSSRGTVNFAPVEKIVSALPRTTRLCCNDIQKPPTVLTLYLLWYVQNAELFTLTYGAMVRQLLIDNEDNVEAVNVQLEKMGYNIGVRLIDEFLAKTSTTRCNDFRETAEVIAKMFECTSTELHTALKRSWAR